MPALPSRKKRKLTANQHRNRTDRNGSARLTQTDLDEIAAPSNDSSLTNKYNLKYEPDDPNLTEEQRAEWRKEQRKARNRASAAASRLKTKARIDELEGEVSELKRMYAAAVARIAELEGGSTSTTSFSPSGIAGRVASTTISPPSSPPHFTAMHDETHEDAANGFPDMPPLDLHVASVPSMVHDSPSSTTLISGNSTSYDHHLDADADADANAEKQHVIETTSLPAA